VRISIWQQFASNNSTNFTVVGTFESNEAAERAAEQLRGIVDKIRRVGTKQFSKADREVLSQLIDIDTWFSFGSDAKRPLDWVQSTAADVPVVVDGNHVFLSDGSCCLWGGPKPFNSLMERFGGNVQIECNDCIDGTPNTTLITTMTLSVPTDQVAQDIVDAVTLFNDNYDFYCLYYGTHKLFGALIEQGIAIQRDNKRLILSDVLCLDRLDEDTLALIRYFQHLNCTDIDYTFHNDLP
jgi:hypothetical protein